VARSERENVAHFSFRHTIIVRDRVRVDHVLIGAISAVNRMNVNRAHVANLSLLLSSLALFALVGCFSREPIDIKSQDPAAKIPAIKQAVEAKDLSAARQLVKDLDSDDPAVRFYAIGGLQRLTGESFGYVYYDDDDARKSAVKRWQMWLASQESGGDAATTQSVAGP